MGGKLSQCSASTNNPDPEVWGPLNVQTLKVMGRQTCSRGARNSFLSLPVGIFFGCYDHPDKKPLQRSFYSVNGVGPWNVSGGC